MLLNLNRVHWLKLRVNSYSVHSVPEFSCAKTILSEGLPEKISNEDKENFLPSLVTDIVHVKLGNFPDASDFLCNESYQ